MGALSPDAQAVAFVAFAHTDTTVLTPGRLLIRRLNGGSVRPAVEDTATYYVPSWSPSGTRIAVAREESVTET